MVFNVCFYVTAAFKSWRLSRRREPWVSRAAGPPAARRALQRERLCSVEKMHFCGSCGSLCFLGEGKRRLERRSTAGARARRGRRPAPGGFALPAPARCCRGSAVGAAAGVPGGAGAVVPLSPALPWLLAETKALNPNAMSLSSCARCQSAAPRAMGQERWGRSDGPFSCSLGRGAEPRGRGSPGHGGFAVA